MSRFFCSTEGAVIGATIDPAVGRVVTTLDGDGVVVSARADVVLCVVVGGLAGFLSLFRISL